MGLSIETVVFPMSPEIVAEMRSRFKHNEGNTEYKDCFPKVECYEGSSCYDPARETVCIFKIHPTMCTCNTTMCTPEDWSRVSPLACKNTSVYSTLLAFSLAYVLVCAVNVRMLFGVVERRVQLLRANDKQIPLTMILLGGWHLISIIFNIAIRFNKTAPRDQYFHVEWLYFLTQGWVILFNALCLYDLARLLNMPTNRVTPALQMRDGSPPRPPPQSPRPIFKWYPNTNPHIHTTTRPL
jgi:hypothetical protein